jgi:hypothetical protein
MKFPIRMEAANIKTGSEAKAASAGLLGGSDQARFIEEFIPQRLKPDLFCGLYGTSKLVPFQSCDLFRGFLTRVMV